MGVTRFAVDEIAELARWHRLQNNLQTADVLDVAARNAALVEQLTETLQDVLSQACDGGDSMALSAYADGLRLMAELGLFKIEREAGRRVIGHWLPAPPTERTT